MRNRGRKQCTAHRHDGSRCTNAPVEGMNVCASHGGNVPRGPQSPHYKHGRYSRHVEDAFHVPRCQSRNLTAQDPCPRCAKEGRRPLLEVQSYEPAPGDKDSFAHTVLRCRHCGWQCKQ